MHKRLIDRVSDPASRERCQGITKFGQCILKKVEGSLYCPIHGGNKNEQAIEKNNIFRYNLACYQTRLTTITDHDDIKSLRSEIAICRMLVQNRLSIITSPADLHLHITSLSTLIGRIQSMAETCAKIEDSLAEFVDRQHIEDLGYRLLIAADKQVGHDSSIMESLTTDLAAVLHRHQGEKADLPDFTLYELGRWQRDIQACASKQRVIDLRNEIGVLRILLENLLTSCSDQVELIHHQGQICSLLEKIESSVRSTNRLERLNGLILNAEEATQIAQEFITILASYITDPMILQSIAEEMK